MFFKLVLKGFKLKKLGVESKMAQSAQQVEKPVDRLCLSGRGLVEGG